MRNSFEVSFARLKTSLFDAALSENVAFRRSCDPNIAFQRVCVFVVRASVRARVSGVRVRTRGRRHVRTCVRVRACVCVRVRACI